MRLPQVVSRVLSTPMDYLDLRRWTLIFLILGCFADFSRAQRLILPPTPDSTTAPTPSSLAVPPDDLAGTSVLKTYPDGTKKIVPLEALNFRDDGAAFGGPPKLSLYQDAAAAPTSLSPFSPERLNLRLS